LQRRITEVVDVSAASCDLGDGQFGGRFGVREEELRDASFAGAQVREEGAHADQRG